MALILIKHQPLSRFLSFLLQLHPFIKGFYTIKIFQIGAVGDLV